ncbi:tyrosine-type recombinase/integrase [Croceicoccus estronivorus]|uniref:tyrosine-type recombinase/integrase n=1 Tax=Croceicoccus estronivorus TaxID=1172626 RepID=UPI0038B2BC1B
MAEEYLTKMKKDGRAQPTVVKVRWFLSLLKPTIGNLPISEVDPQMLLAALKRLEARGNYETAKKTRSFGSRVFRYAVATARTKQDPADLLKGALIAPKARHYAAIQEGPKLGELLRAIDDYFGQPVTNLALRIGSHVFVRPGELRHAEWNEIDLDPAVWRVPEGKIKARRPHSVLLSRQIVALFKELRSMTGPSGLVFPAFHTSRRSMSENTLNAALRRMGFAKDEVSAHGLPPCTDNLLTRRAGAEHRSARARPA